MPFSKNKSSASHATAILILLAFSFVLPFGEAWADSGENGIVVWRIEAKTGVALEDVESLSGYLDAEVEKVSGMEVVSQADIETVLRGEETRQRCGASDTSCMAEIGNALGVPEAVSGDLGRVGDVWILNLRRVNLKDVGVLKRVSRQTKGQSLTSMVEALSGAVAELFGKEYTPTATVSKTSGEESKALEISGYSLLGGGAAMLIVGGVATWQMDESNGDDKSKFDTWKSTAIAGYAIGGAALISGAVLLIVDAVADDGKGDKNEADLTFGIAPTPSGVSAGVAWRW